MAFWLEAVVIFVVVVSGVVVAFAFLLSRMLGTYPEVKPTTSNIIVISGCDTGFGRLAALNLAEMGFYVIAGVLQEQSVDELLEEAESLAGRITPVILDITKDDSIHNIAAVAAELCKEDRQVVGLVNNAGIGVPGPLEFVSSERMRLQLDVNTFGHHSMTAALLPLIRTSKGRIVNIVSIAGRIATTMMGPYSMSKFAMEAFTDALRLELYSHGVSVSAIEPGFAKTNIVGQWTAESMEREWNRFPPAAKTVYAEIYEGSKKEVEYAWDSAMDPMIVIGDIIHALTSTHPQTRYLSGTQAKVIAFICWAVPDRLQDLLVMQSSKLARR